MLNKKDKGGRKPGENYNTGLNQKIDNILDSRARRLSIHLDEDLYQFYRRRPFDPTGLLSPMYWGLQALCVYYPLYLSLTGQEYWISYQDSLVIKNPREDNKPWNMKVPKVLMDWYDTLPEIRSVIPFSIVDSYGIGKRLGTYRTTSRVFHVRRSLVFYRKIIEIVDPVLIARGHLPSVKMNFLTFTPTEIYDFYMSAGIDFSRDPKNIYGNGKGN